MEERREHPRRRCGKPATTATLARQGRGSESALYEVLCPAVYILRVFGLAPYAYPPDNRPPRLHGSRLNSIYTLVWLSIYTYIIIVSLMRFEGLDRDKPVLGVTENGKMILNYLVILSDLILGVLWRNQFVHVWNSIQEFDESHELGRVSPVREGSARYGPMLRRTRLWLWAALLASFLGWLTINQLGMIAFNEPYLMNVSYMITYVGSFVAVFKFTGLVFLLGQRFAYLSDLVGKRRLLPLGKTEAGAFIKKIEDSYNQLMSTSEKLNDIYSWSLLLFLLNLFCHAVSNMYFFTIWTIVDPRYLNNPTVIFVEFCWLVAYLVQLLFLHLSCHFASMEADRMAVDLLNWRRHMYRQNKQSEFSSTLHLLNRKLSFTAAGCFKVNLPLFTSTIGHLTTYLVILLQLPDNNSDN